MHRVLQGKIPYLIVALLVATPAFAGEKDKGLKIDIEGEDGEHVSIDISSNLVEGIIAGLAESDMECDTTTDEDTLAMLQHLDRKGEGSKYSYTNEEGEKVKARRHKGQWEMEVVKAGEENTFISMPWSMAECMLGRDVPAHSRREDFKFQIEKDGAVSIRIE